jgi:exopolyphosphatase/guanosine-5'-triphosphate,3'-diphosphate pyrophosphatase
MKRYHVDMKQAERVNRLSGELARQLFGQAPNESALQLLGWVAHLHGVGIRVAHSGYHKHTAYILANADMPGFSKKEQVRLSLLALAHRGNLKKLIGLLTNTDDFVLAMSLRLAALFYRNRSDVDLPDIQLTLTGAKYGLSVSPAWLKLNPLTEAALQEEVKQWKALGVSLQLGKK